MKHEFRHLRATSNYNVYEDGKGNVIYLPRDFRNGSFTVEPILNGPRIRETTPTPEPTPCCFRDNDGDGNCIIHEAPGVLRRRYPPPVQHASEGRVSQNEIRERFAVQIGLLRAILDEMRQQRINNTPKTPAKRKVSRRKK